MFSRLVFILIALVGFSTPSFAKSIIVEKAWAESEGADRADVFFVIKNTGSAKDRLYAVKSKMSKKAVLEGGADKEGEDKDHKEVLGFEIPAGKSMEFSEDGPHVEMTGVKEKLVSGSKFQVTLYFEEAGPIKVEVTVGD